MKQFDSGCQSLVTLASLQQIPAEYQQIRHRFGVDDVPMSDTDLLRAAKALGFKARKFKNTAAELSANLLPVMAKKHTGEYFIIAKISPEADKNGQALVLHSQQTTPQQLTLNELDEIWSGEGIMLTKREGLITALSEFDIRWFIPPIMKYRKLFGEVLIASFFIQLFALVTPLFF